MIGRSRSGDGGFTLIEMLAALGIMAAIVAALSVIAGQWLPTWRFGFSQLQRTALLAQAFDRFAADFSAAEPMQADAKSQEVAFTGDSRSAIFVRSSLGPNAAPGLELVRFSEVQDSRGYAMVRASAPYRPGTGEPKFSAPVVLARSPYRVAFAYAGVDRNWRDAWPRGPNLPNAVRITVHDGANGFALAASTATRLHVTARTPALKQEATKPPPGDGGQPAPDGPARGASNP